MVKINNHQVGKTGYGLMHITWRPEPLPEEPTFAAMKAAINRGSIFWNGGEFYGSIVDGPNSLTLLNKYFTKYPEDASKVVLSIKGGLRPDMQNDCSPEGLASSVDNCLRLLPPSIKKIDLFEFARVDPRFPIEDQVRVLAGFVAEGKIGAISLSEVKADTIRRAAAVATISAVEIELSLWETFFLSNGVMEACAELGIPVVAYSPLGRGFLSGRFKSPDDIPEGDFRRHMPRFSAENFPKNLELLDRLKAFANKKGCTPAQLALAWVRGLSGRNGRPEIIPIPGATTEERVVENTEDVSLTDAETDELNAIIKNFDVQGHRYPERAQAALAQ